MKIFWFLFNIYLLVLAGLPCTDHDVHAVKNQTKHQIVQMQLDGHDSHHQDTCTPFCHCACCGFSITIPEINILQLTPSFQCVSIIKNYAYNDDFMEDVFLMIWQPPKLVA